MRREDCELSIILEIFILVWGFFLCILFYLLEFIVYIENKNFYVGEIRVI